MNEQARCPQCDAEIPPGAPAGLCPKCLFQAGLDSQQPVAPQFPPTQPSPPPSRFEPPAPEELAARFPQLEILALLGRGGMGAVYKAKQRGLDRLVALKILPPEVSADPAFAERFTREARALAKLTHSNIVTVYDFGQAASARRGSPDPAVPATEGLPSSREPQETFGQPGGSVGDRPQREASARRGSPDPADPGGSVGDRPQRGANGLFYFLMEYVDGVNLRQAIQAGEMTPQDALAIVPQICAALQFAHDEGIVHRDIKPENILIDKRGRVKIADFGLAKLLGQDASDHSLTATHQVMGTLRYMAPEQMQGSREVDHRADIYSLGVIFYELLTGELPMGRFAPPSKKVQLDVRLDEIVLRALEQEPEQRYQHASEVKTDVEAISRSRQPESLARPEPAKDAATGSQLVQAPADCLLMAAGIAFVTAWGVAILMASRENDITTPLVGGNLTIALIVLTYYYLLIGVGGLLLRRLRARLFVLLAAVIAGLFLPAVVALIVMMELPRMPEWRVAIPLWLGMPAALWVAVTLLRDDVRRAFATAAEQRAEKTGTTPVSWHHTSAEIQMQIRGPAVLLHDDIKAAFHAQTKSQSRPQTPDRVADAVPPLVPKRQKLVPVLATFNLVGAILLMLVCAMEEPAGFARPVPRLWKVWETVDAVLGFSMAAGMFAASIGLFLWKPWARKLTLGVCVFGLASFVFDAPYLARFALPDAYAEIQQTVIAEGVEPDLQDVVTLSTFVLIFGGLFVFGLTCLIGQLVYFTRPRVVAAFESQGETYGKFVEWLFTGAGAVVGVLSVFGPLALLLGLSALFNQEGGEHSIDSSGNRADSKTGESWWGNKGEEHVMFWGPNSPTVSDRLADHLGLDPSQREAMNQAFQRLVREFKALEEQNTRHETDENGHQITTIAPLQKQLPQLQERFWSELDSALDGRQLTLGRKTLFLSAGMFNSGELDYRIEIWRVGQINPWYHWKEGNPLISTAPSANDQPSSGPELPENRRRFWKEPE